MLGAQSHMQSRLPTPPPPHPTTTSPRQGVYTVGVVLMFPAMVMAMAAGAIFGMLYGSLLVWVGSSVGQTVAFVIGRWGPARAALHAGACQFETRGVGSGRHHMIAVCGGLRGVPCMGNGRGGRAVRGALSPAGRTRCRCCATRPLLRRASKALCPRYLPRGWCSM